MRTEIICVGTELLTGKLNSNTAYLGEKLSALGLDPVRGTTVGDGIVDIERAVARALDENDIVIVTGGLGPTFDDLTREAAARAVSLRLVTEPEIVEALARRFRQRGIEMPKNNERQAQVIEGAQALANSLGTAPGQLLEFEREGRRRLLVLLPGPPREMQHVFETGVVPRLKRFETRIKKSFTLRVCGLAESVVDEKIRLIVEAERALDKGSVDFTILAHQMIVDIRASAWGEDEMLVDEMLNNIRHELHEVLGRNIYGEGRQTLQGVVGELLAKHRKTLALAESCTGGLVAQRITDVSGSSLYLREGVVAYSNEAKAKLLGVRKETLERFGAVSSETAGEMADGAKALSGADYALSLTGIAGPGGGTPEKPVGLVYIGLRGPRGGEVFKLQLPGNRTEIRERAANQALDLLRRRLLDDIAQS